MYEIPIQLDKAGVGDRLSQKLGLAKKKVDISEWAGLVNKIKRIKKEVRIGIVGKYFGTGNFTLSDSYLSVIEAIKHASYDLGVKPKIDWVDAGKWKTLNQYDGIIIPGGFGGRDIEGKIKAIRYAREKKGSIFGSLLWHATCHSRICSQHSRA